MASASISTSMSGSIKRFTSTMVVAGPDRPKHLPMCAADFLPLIDIGHINARPHDIRNRCAGPHERRFNRLQGLNGLRVGIILPHESCSRHRSGAGDLHGLTDPHCRE